MPFCLLSTGISLFLLPDSLVKGPSTASGPTQEPWCWGARGCSTSPWGVPRDLLNLALCIHPHQSVSFPFSPFLPLQTLLNSHVSPKPYTHTHTHTHTITLLDSKPFQQPLLLQRALLTRRKVTISPHPYPYPYLRIPGCESGGKKLSIQHGAWHGRAFVN